MQAEESTSVGYSAILRIGSLLLLIGVLGWTYDLVGVSIAIVISTILNTIILYFLYKRSIITKKKQLDCRQEIPFYI